MTVRRRRSAFQRQENRERDNANGRCTGAGDTAGGRDAVLKMWLEIYGFERSTQKSGSGYMYAMFSKVEY